MTTADLDREDYVQTTQCMGCGRWSDTRFVSKALTVQWDGTGKAFSLDYCPDCRLQCTKCGEWYATDEVALQQGVPVCDPCKVYDEFGDTQQYKAELARWRT